MIGVKEQGLGVVVKTLESGLAQLQNPSELHEIIGQLGKAQTRQRFYDQKDPNGVPWAELQPETIKRKHGRTDKLMNRLDLIKSITFVPIDGGVFVFADLPAERVAPHQFGDRARNIPKRAIFGLSTENQADIAGATIVWLEGLF